MSGSTPGVRFARRTRGMRASAVRELLKRAGPDTISLAGGLPSSEAIPIGEIEAAAGRALQRFGARALQYGPTEGMTELRERVAGGLPGAGPDDVLVTSGSQQGLDLVARILLDPGDTVAVAAPTYMGALRAFDASEARYLEVASDADGPLPEAVEAALAQRPKAFYVIPDFDNPSGARTTLARRHALLAAAARHDVPVVEDAPYRELRFEGEALPTLFELAPERVWHLGTASKTLAPGLRVAWLVAPPEVRTMAVRAKQAADLHTGSFTQAVVLEALEAGVVDERLASLRAHYRERRNALDAALRDALGTRAAWSRPPGGMFLWLRLEGEVDAEALVTRAVEHGVTCVPGSAFFTGDGGRSHLRLSFSLHEPERLVEGARRLARALEAQEAA